MDRRFEIRITVVCIEKDHEIGQVSQNFDISEDLINLSLINFEEFENILRHMISDAMEVDSAFKEKE